MPTSTIPHIFTGWMPFVPPNQQHQSTEGNWYIRIREKMLEFSSTVLPTPSPLHNPCIFSPSHSCPFSNVPFLPSLPVCNSGSGSDSGHGHGICVVSVHLCNCAELQCRCLKFYTICVSWTPWQDLRPPVASQHSSECLRWCLLFGSGRDLSE